MNFSTVFGRQILFSIKLKSIHCSHCELYKERLRQSKWCDVVLCSGDSITCSIFGYTVNFNEKKNLWFNRTEYTLQTHAHVLSLSTAYCFVFTFVGCKISMDFSKCCLLYSYSISISIANNRQHVNHIKTLGQSMMNFVFQLGFFLSSTPFARWHIRKSQKSVNLIYKIFVLLNLQFRYIKFNKLDKI